MQTRTQTEDQIFLLENESWLAGLPVLKMTQAFPEPERGVLISVDIIKGFCTIGPLASPRIDAVVPAIAGLMEHAWAHGIRHILLGQDTHEPDAKEFAAWPPHCVRGTPESETVEEIRALPFFDQMLIIEKNSISTGLEAKLTDWSQRHPEVNSFVVVGDCTDLCVYQMAMHLRMQANARQLDRRVIVPENAVQTYDRSVETARREGGLPHPGDLLHRVFLYHIALNGIEVVARID